MPLMINLRAEKKVDEIKFMDEPQGEGSHYPGGLKIYLTQEEINKLNLDPLPEIGKQIFFKIQAEVVGITKTESQGKTLDLQITDMGIMEGAMREEDGTQEASTTLYTGPPKKMNFVGGGF